MLGGDNCEPRHVPKQSRCPTTTEVTLSLLKRNNFETTPNYTQLFSRKMGKSKKKPRPTKISGLTKDRPVKTFADPETEILHKQKILPVLKDLTSPEPNSRSLAASAIANLIEDAKCRKLLLKERLVRVLMEQTITDANLEVAVRGWGVFRNLALEEGSDFGLHLYRLDILTSLEAALKSVGNEGDDALVNVSSAEWPVRSLLHLMMDPFYGCRRSSKIAHGI